MKNNNTKKYIKLIIIFICLIGFLMLLEDVFEKEIMTLDVKGYEIISKLIKIEGTKNILKFITNIGGTITLITLAGVSLLISIIKHKKEIGIAIVANLSISALLNTVLKHIIQRDRPIGYRLIDETGYSFPSGHSMNSMAFYGFMIYLIYKFVKNKYIKYIAITILSILIVSIGISRIYLGVHYTSDVIAGFLVSISYLIIYTNIIRNYIVKENSTK